MRSEKDVKGLRCPRCGAPRDPEFRPFCSRGCRDRDLIGWFDESYRVPVVEAAEDDSSDENDG